MSGSAMPTYIGTEAYRRGYERGRAYLQGLTGKPQL